MDLLSNTEIGPVTVEAVAAHAGVGKQTIYRWWPSRAALVTEALTEGARDRVRDIDSGDSRRDLEHFLVSTFRAVSLPAVTRALRSMMADAMHDAHAAEVLQKYTAARRSALESIIRRGVGNGHFRADVDVALIVEQTFGFLWYRLLLGHAPLNRKAALVLADGLLCQLGVSTNPPSSKEPT